MLYGADCLSVSSKQFMRNSVIEKFTTHRIATLTWLSHFRVATLIKIFNLAP